MELYNIEAEQSILGAILIEPKSISEGNEVNLSSSDFYLDKHKTIYKCMKKLSDSDLEIDLIILSNELKNDKTLDEIGGVAYISSLITIVPTADNIIYYMKIVKNLAMKRYIHNMLLQAGTNIQSMDTSALINFTDELKSTLLECTNVNDLFIDASTISLKTENSGAIETGFRSIDNVTGGGLNFGTLTVVTGEPGSGKSTFLNQILANALSLGFNGFLYSGELTYQMIMEWFAKTVANTKHLSICTNNFGQYVRLSDEGFEMISNWTKDKLFIYSKEARADEINLANAIEYLAIKKNVKLFILDNLMTLECSGSDKYEKQIIAVKALKNLAKKYNLVVILVAHSNKSSFMNREPHVFEISGASEIPNLADYIFKTTREDGKPFTHALILKNRITGIIKKRALLEFKSERKRFFTKGELELQKDFGYEPTYEQDSFC